MRYLLIFLLTTLTVTSQYKYREDLLKFEASFDTGSPESLSTYDEIDAGGKKNTGLAILYSLLLPGMGELYGGDYSIGKYLTIADAVFWGFFIGFNVYSDNQKDNYMAFASAKGEVSSAGKDDQYWADIGEYVSVDQYNRIQDLNRDFGNRYNVESHYWNWNDNAVRREYRSMWTSSEQAKNNIRFAVGALILNRIVSAINAVRVVSAYNKRLEEDAMGWNLSVGIDSRPTLPSSLNLYFQKSF